MKDGSNFDNKCHDKKTTYNLALEGFDILIFGFDAIVIGINLLFIYIYRSTRNKIAALLNIGIGGFTVYLGFIALSEDKNGFGIYFLPIFLVGLYSILITVRDLFRKHRDKKVS